MTKLIIFNGPPHSGKDHAVRTVLPRLPMDESEISHVKFSAPLKFIVTTLTGIPAQGIEQIKDKILPDYGMTPRDLQIAAFNSLAQSFGADVLGKMLKNTILRLGCDVALVSDCGRQEEINPLIKEFGAANILIIQIARKGCTFSHDIRSYVSDPRVTTEMLLNNGTQVFEEEVFTTIVNFLAGEG